MGAAMCTPVQREAAVGRWAGCDPEAPPETGRCYRQILQEGFASIHRRPAGLRPTGTRALPPGGSPPASGAARGVPGAEARLTLRVDVELRRAAGDSVP